MRRRWWYGIVLVAIVLLCAGVLLPCGVNARDDGVTKVSNCLKHIARALHHYHDTYGKLPPAIVRDKEGRPLYSWRVAILPFLEQNDLYQEFHLDEPWDSPHNLPLAEKIFPYMSYSFSYENIALTRFQVLIGPGTAFERPGLTFDDFKTELANAILVVEANEPVVWSKPVDLAFDPEGPLPSLYMEHLETVDLLCLKLWRYNGTMACFADNSARFIPHYTSEPELRALIRRN